MAGGFCITDININFYLFSNSIVVMKSCSHLAKQSLNPCQSSFNDWLSFPFLCCQKNEDLYTRAKFGKGMVPSLPPSTPIEKGVLKSLLIAVGHSTFSAFPLFEVVLWSKSCVTGTFPFYILKVCIIRAYQERLQLKFTQWLCSLSQGNIGQALDEFHQAMRFAAEQKEIALICQYEVGQFTCFTLLTVDTNNGNNTRSHNCIGLKNRTYNLPSLKENLTKLLFSNIFCH